MEHLIRIGATVYTMDDEHPLFNKYDAYYAPADELDYGDDGAVLGRRVLTVPPPAPLKFHQRQDRLKRGPEDPDTITREQYYRRDGK